LYNQIVPIFCLLFEETVNVSFNRRIEEEQSIYFVWVEVPSYQFSQQLFFEIIITNGNSELHWQVVMGFCY